MKNKITLLFLLISFFSHSQSSKENRDTINREDYEAELKWNNSSIIISNYKTSTQIEKTLILKTASMDCGDKKGIYLKLSNGEILSFDNAEVICEFLSTNNYSISGSIEITSELFNKLTQLEITEFAFGKFKVPVKFKDENESLRGLLKFSEQY